MTADDDAVARLTNLTFGLLGAETPRTHDWVRANVAGYEDRTDQAFQRLIQRDVASIRRAGVPARSENGLVWVDKDSYELPPIEFTDAEATVLGLAGDLGQAGSLGAFARSGWTKLAASGATRSFDDAPLASMDNDVLRLSADLVKAVTACIRTHTRMSFDYRPSPTAEVQRRVMDPWGIVALHNKAYIAGWDIERGAPRSFRAIRVSNVRKVRSDEFITTDRDLQEVVEESLRGPTTTATLLIDEPAPELTDKATGDGEHWVLRDVERDWLVRTVASYADQVVVVKPDDVRADVLALLEAAHEG
ncbi:helix-turn-helix transcriptional regulator [Corynebacterium pilosum]|uniref:Transcriptional regulator n=1 Tax=Corynebacterium pilosum TaxID=35756 RepID=A0A376CQ93_9CORY|nr:WYL domain-containing protein [Corynebacterium pilosum]STC70442.1 transcriptional regulator [Corynebacterium pilosum]